MTRRERAEARLERRRQWAAGRQAKAAAGFAVGDPYRGDIAFNTQPGHIPERARVIKAHDRACEDMNMAQHHEQKAAGIESQLANTIFSDDTNAVEALQAKIAKERSQVERMKEANKIIRKNKDNQEAGKAALVQAGFTQSQADKLYTPDFGGRLGFPGYALTNAGANIRRMEKRIVEITDMTERKAVAEMVGGVAITGGEVYVNITFAEKPEREILDALRAAGFSWGRGCWMGYREKIPACVIVLIHTQIPELTQNDDATDDTNCEYHPGMRLQAIA